MKVGDYCLDCSDGLHGDPNDPRMVKWNLKHALFQVVALSGNIAAMRRVTPKPRHSEGYPDFLVEIVGSNWIVVSKEFGEAVRNHIEEQLEKEMKNVAEARR